MSLEVLEENQRSILLRYHEIAIKGDNRGWFEERLAINARKLLQRNLPKGTPFQVVKHYGRIEIQADWNEVTQSVLHHLFGVSSFSPMLKVKTQKEVITQAALSEFKRCVGLYGPPRTFRVKTRRSDKVFPETSNELDRLFGSVIKAHYPEVEVDLKNPQIMVGIEIHRNESFLWVEKVVGQSGLPVGSNGRVLSLISGGIDSPVATIYALRRGSPASYVHFYGAPFVGEEVLDKIEDLVRVMNRFQPDPQPLHLIPFGKIQEKIALATHPKMRTLLYRRMMIRIANHLAKKIGAHALVTGEALGQVASQTIENMVTINSVTTIPILRPLVTFDKDEIIARAQKWGTFETSIRPGLDCCTLFGDRHPTLRSSIEELEAQEKNFPVDEFVREALEMMILHKSY